MAEAAGRTKAVAAPFSIALAPPHAAAAAAAAVPGPNFSAANAASVAGDIETPLIEPSRSLGDSMPAGTRVVRPWAGKGGWKKRKSVGGRDGGKERGGMGKGKEGGMRRGGGGMLLERTSSALFIRLPPLHWANPPFPPPHSPLCQSPLSPPLTDTGEDQLRSLHPPTAPPSGQSGAHRHGMGGGCGGRWVRWVLAGFMDTLHNTDQQTIFLLFSKESTALLTKAILSSPAAHRCTVAIASHEQQQPLPPIVPAASALCTL
ncbi:unnamed protein product [Closterium sp. Naga37s-1]|nr:unnamed protein product [Closterium sp. Naga37s-1]